MTYQQTIDYLYEQLPMFSRIGAAAYKKDLHNTVALCNELGNPEAKFKSVHIAGTNGKGSTSHMLAAILQEAGYKTGLYTSPHLKDFGERIKINGEMINENFVIDFVERTKKITTSIEPSFFELTVAMAFEYFAKEKVDIAIIETGLGGRLDSTNVITPLVSIITNIGFDHMNLLGNTLPEIATEKAGIIKHNIPVVVGEYNNETEPIFLQKAKEADAPIHFAGERFIVTSIISTLHDLQCEVKDSFTSNITKYRLDLNGLYQTKNLPAVLLAKDILTEKGFHLTDEVVSNALANVKKLTGLHGRWDVIHQNPTVVLDVAHNEDGIKQILNQLTANKQPFFDVHFVTGMVKDKEIDKVLALLPKESAYYFTNAHIPRALLANELKTHAENFGLNGNAYEDVNAALKAAMQDAGKDKLVIVCGSVFLVGEVEL